jgi:hypothetical protein
MVRSRGVLLLLLLVAAAPSPSADVAEAERWVAASGSDLDRLPATMPFVMGLTLTAADARLNWNLAAADCYALAGDVAAYRATLARIGPLLPTASARMRDCVPAALAGASLLVGDRAAYDRGVAEAMDYPHHHYSVRTVIKHLADFNRLDDALALSHRLTSPADRAVTLNDLAPMFAHANRRADYERVMRQDEADTAAAMAAEKDPRDRESHLSDLAGAQVASGDPDRAEATIAKLTAGEERAQWLVDVALAYRRAGNQPGYNLAMDTAIRQAAAEPRADRFSQVYADVGKALARADDEPRMLAATATAGPARTYLPMEFDFERARMAARAGDVATAQRLLARAEAAHAKLVENQLPYFDAAGVKHWRVVVALARAGKDEAALAMVPGLPPLMAGMEPSKSVAIWSPIAEAQAKGGRVAAARATLGRITNPKDRDDATDTAIGAAADAGVPPEQLRAWVATMHDPVSRMNAQLRVADALLRQAGRLRDDRTTAGDDD